MWFYRHLLQVDDDSTESITNDNIKVNDNEFIIDPGPIFPPDLFTIEQLKNGAIILHIIGIVTRHQNIYLIYIPFILMLASFSRYDIHD